MVIWFTVWYLYIHTKLWGILSPAHLNIIRQNTIICHVFMVHEQSVWVCVYHGEVVQSDCSYLQMCLRKLTKLLEQSALTTLSALATCAKVRCDLRSYLCLALSLSPIWKEIFQQNMQTDIKKLTVTSPFSKNRTEKRGNEILKVSQTHSDFAWSHSSVLFSLYLFHGEHFLIVLLAEVTMAGFFFKLQMYVQLQIQIT